jgi:hypothetical protein
VYAAAVTTLVRGQASSVSIVDETQPGADIMTGAKILLACLATVACSSSSEPKRPTMASVAGTYVAFRGTTSTTRGVLTTTSESGQVTDRLAAGGTITLVLRADGTTAGHAFVPDPLGEDLDADLTGTWTLSGSTVHLTHAADTFLRDMDFEASDTALASTATFFGTRVSVRLDKSM